MTAGIENMSVHIVPDQYKNFHGAFSSLTLYVLSRPYIAANGLSSGVAPPSIFNIDTKYSTSSILISVCSGLWLLTQAVHERGLK